MSREPDLEFVRKGRKKAKKTGRKIGAISRPGSGETPFPDAGGGAARALRRVGHSPLGHVWSVEQSVQRMRSVFRKKIPQPFGGGRRIKEGRYTSAFFSEDLFHFFDARHFFHQGPFNSEIGRASWRERLEVAWGTGP